MTLDVHNYSRKPPKKKRVNVFFIIIGILAIPSSLAGINEFTNFFEYNPEQFGCNTGIRDGWYKNCEYKFQFDIPTDNWTITDSNSNKIYHTTSQFSNSKIVSFLYDYGSNATTDAYGGVSVIDLRDFLDVTFDYYEQLFVQIHQKDERLTNLIHSRDKNLIKFNFQVINNHKTFHCSEIHNLKIKLVYYIVTCKNENAQDVDYIKTDLYKFLKTFQFF